MMFALSYCYYVVDIWQAFGAPTSSPEGARRGATNASRISNLYAKRSALMGEKPVHFRLLVENVQKLCEKGCILTFLGRKAPFIANWS